MQQYIYNLSALFEHVVSRNHDSVALELRNKQSLSYSDLDTLSNQVAHWLSAEGLKPGDLVGIFHDKSPLAYAAMLACLKAGFVYTNLDQDSPWERLRKILGTCEPKLVLSFSPDFSFGEEMDQAGIRVCEMSLPAIVQALKNAPTDPHPNRLNTTGATPAYVMFTSGSTGMPKGAVMSHGNLLNFIQWAGATFEIGPGDLLSNANPMYFDNSVFDFYASLFNGASLLPVTAAEVRDPRNLVHVINESRCTVWFSVPSLLVYLLTTRALKTTDFPSIRKFIFGGEGFPKPKLKELFDLFGHRADLENVYGPTECTCICSSHRITERDFDDMQSLATLGYMAPNFGYEILPQDSTDPDFGELFLKGPQVGFGYFNDPERTSRSFVQNPRHNQFRDIGYRTGDLVKRDSSGQLHFKGRADFQIKHMGYRIELEEIEAALSTVAGVKECAVVYRQIAAGMGQIIGFAALHADEEHTSDLVAAVAGIVPSYMVPRRVVILPGLPKNANGKIDRVQLQQQAGGAT